MLLAPLMYVLGLPSSDVPSSSSSEQCSAPSLSVGTTSMIDDDAVIEISDSESDKDASQCQVELQRDPDMQVVVGRTADTEVVTSSVTVESHYLFNDPIEGLSGNGTAPATTNVSTRNVTGELHHVFSNPAVQGSVDGTAPAITSCNESSNSVASESRYLFGNPTVQGSVDGTAPAITSCNESSNSAASESRYLFSNPTVQGSVDNIVPITTTAPTSSVISESCYLFSNPNVQSSVATTEVAISSASSKTASDCNDIGALLLPSKSVDEITSTMHNLSNSEKYSLLFNHIEPPRVLPGTYAFGCSRKFNIEWLTTYAWLRYSPKLDAVFCGPCSVLLAADNRADKGLLVNRPFSQWVKLSDSLSRHAKLVYHHQAVQSADILKNSIENPNSRLDIMSSHILQSRIMENKHIFNQIVRAIEYLAKQGLSFRGHRESIESETNPGNFLSLLRIFAENDDVLRAHLQKPKAKNATYLSPSSQNDIIEVIGFDYIRAKIIAEIKQAPYFSIIADEVTSHNTEYLSLCLRYVDARCEIQENFMAFVELPRIRASDVSKAILDTLDKLKLSVSDLRGQCYDGASNMSGQKSGVQKQIRDLQSKAVYTHCAGHSLNLVIVSSCTIPPVRNCISQIKSLTIWIKSSPKRAGFLKVIVQKGIQKGTVSSRNPLLNVCITRWVENIEGWERFCLTFPFIIEMLEAIIYGTSDNDFQTFNDGWTGEDKAVAMAQLKALESFEFLYTLVTLQRSLMYFKEAAVKLQGEQQDLASGIVQVEKCSKELKRLRADVNDFSGRIHAHACTIARKCHIDVSTPRISRHQQHRSNQQTDSVEEYFKVSIVIPFIDHLISELSCRFDAHTKQSASLQHLIPHRITQSTSYADIDEAVQYYKDDLPNSCVVDEEFERWKQKWVAMPINRRPETLNKCLKECCPKTLPNLFVLLKIFATIPMSACSCERSASGLRRLNNYLRTTQGEERLSALAIIHSNYTTKIDRDYVLKLFMTKHPRRMECGTLL